MDFVSYRKQGVVGVDLALGGKYSCGPCFIPKAGVVEVDLALGGKYNY